LIERFDWYFVTLTASYCDPRLAIEIFGWILDFGLPFFSDVFLTGSLRQISNHKLFWWIFNHSSGGFFRNDLTDFNDVT